MHQAGRFDRWYIMNKIKMLNTNLITMGAEIFEQIKDLAAKLNKDKNNLLEEAAQDLIKKYEHKVSSQHPKPLPNADPDYSSQTEMLG
jgi:hypothetical protein